MCTETVHKSLIHERHDGMNTKLSAYDCEFGELNQWSKGAHRANVCVFYTRTKHRFTYAGEGMNYIKSGWSKY